MDVIGIRPENVHVVGIFVAEFHGRSEYKQLQPALQAVKTVSGAKFTDKGSFPPGTIADLAVQYRGGDYHLQGVGNAGIAHNGYISYIACAAIFTIFQIKRIADDTA